MHKNDFSHVMTVAQLRTKLAALPDDMPIVMSNDGEGNDYSPLSETEEGMYLPESTWSGDLYMTPEQVAARTDASEEDEAPDGSVRVLVLWPVN
jgi:hypothetical protein